MSNIFKPSPPALWKPPLGTQINRSHPLTKGLVGAWVMNEGGGTLVKDVTGVGGDAALTSVGWNAGKFGPATTYNGSTSYAKVTAPAGSPLDISGTQISFGGWFNRTNTGNYHFFMGRVNATRQYCMFLFSGGTTNVYCAIGSNTITPAIPSYSLGVWNHLILTYDGANARIYLNGVLASTTAATGAIGSVFGGNNFFGYEQPASTFPFPGGLDCLVTYNRCITASEVQQLYSRPFCFMQPSRGIILPSSSAAVVSKQYSFVG